MEGTGNRQSIWERPIRIPAFLFPRRIVLFITFLFVLLIAIRVIFNPFLTGFRQLQIGMSESEFDTLFAADRYERKVVGKTSGGKCIIIFRNRIDADPMSPENRIPEKISSAREIPYLYGNLVVSFDADGLLDGYSWDGEGGNAGKEFSYRRN